MGSALGYDLKTLLHVADLLHEINTVSSEKHQPVEQNAIMDGFHYDQKYHGTGSGVSPGFKVRLEPKH